MKEWDLKINDVERIFLLRFFRELDLESLVPGLENRYFFSTCCRLYDCDEDKPIFLSKEELNVLEGVKEKLENLL